MEVYFLPTVRQSLASGITNKMYNKCQDVFLHLQILEILGCTHRLLQQ